MSSGLWSSGPWVLGSLVLGSSGPLFITTRLYACTDLYTVGQIILFSFAVVTIGFNTVAYSVLEDAGSVNVTASILNGTLARNVVVTLSTESDGTATGEFNIL